MKLKASLLYYILNNPQDHNKFSNSFLNLKNVLDIEKDEGKFSDNILKSFKEIEEEYDSFIQDIPLRVIERYYIDNRTEYKKHVYLAYGEKELSDLTILQLYDKLEEFFSKVFNLAVRTANYYNIEIKTNKKAEKVEESSNEFF